MEIYQKIVCLGFLWGQIKKQILQKSATIFIITTVSIVYSIHYMFWAYLSFNLKFRCTDILYFILTSSCSRFKTPFRKVRSYKLTEKVINSLQKVINSPWVYKNLRKYNFRLFFLHRNDARRLFSSSIDPIHLVRTQVVDRVDQLWFKCSLISDIISFHNL